MNYQDDENQLFPWVVTIKHGHDHIQHGQHHHYNNDSCHNNHPKIMIRSRLNSNIIREPEIARRIEQFLVKSGHQMIHISMGLMISMRGEDYYLGVAIDQPDLPTPHNNDFHHINYHSNTVNKNVHVVIAYIGKEIICDIRERNLYNCNERYSLINSHRFNLLERLEPIIVPNDECGYRDGKKVYYRPKK